jgi:hypothetical protein
MDEPMQPTDRALEAEEEGGEPELGDAGKGKDGDEGFTSQDIGL